ncbi:hypothetical protein M378DRAFT_161966 [Amanita muscaria Koide BX008]|uniref:Uncharacterized protein n=1 Tax=Amanita muscaria (strain Koide BX008) TaxID=946122 RepID=A0A0C2XA47_AMAMK|nr:hypothetical protein M378DRAFT_161966 [Amanita muscaria Koide BX008]
MGSQQPLTTTLMSHTTKYSELSNQYRLSIAYLGVTSGAPLSTILDRNTGTQEICADTEYFYYKVINPMVVLNKHANHAPCHRRFYGNFLPRHHTGDASRDFLQQVFR